MMTVTVDEKLLNRAAEYTGIPESETLVRMALEALVQREASRRLAKLGGTMPDFQVPGRDDFGIRK